MNSIRAGTVSRVKPSGSRTAIPATGPRPGSAPMMVPTSTPMTHQSMAAGLHSPANPSRSAPISFMVCDAPSRSEQAARAEVHSQPDVEEQVGDQERARGDDHGRPWPHPVDGEQRRYEEHADGREHPDQCAQDGTRG